MAFIRSFKEASLLKTSVLPCLYQNTACTERYLATSSSLCKATLPQCDFQPESLKVPDLEKIKGIRKENLFPGLLTYYKTPVYIHQGHMQWLYDNEGKRYLDMFAGIVTVSVGHCHPRVNKALHDQIERLWHTTNIYLHPNIHTYAEELTSKLPGNLKVCYFTNSGSEANDLAMYMARCHTGAYDIISMRNAYHGMSPFLMGVTALSTWRFPAPTGFGVYNTVNPDPYRGPWGGSHCRDSPVQTTRSCNCTAGSCHAKDMYVEQLKDLLIHSCSKKVAGFFAESIQGVGGTVQFPIGFMKGAYDLIREKGGICIADEVQTGFGRLGSHFWGFESHDVMPDIVTMAKGIGNGMPLAAVVTTPEIAESLSYSLHFNTYGGNPMSSAVGSAVLKVIEEEGLQENCEKVGTHLLLELAKLRDRYEIVGDVRGKGLMVGMEMVTDKESRTPLPAARIAAIWEETKEMGVLIGKGGLHGNVFRIKPPMCVTKEDVDFTVAVLEEAIKSNIESN